MAEENEAKLEPVLGAVQPLPPATPAPAAIDAHRALTRLLRKRLKKFLALAPEVHADVNPKTIHDARVWSRRLQQAISAFFPKPRSGKVRRLRRTPRRIRRLLGAWRNCDVLIEMVAKQERRTRSEAKRRAWIFVRDSLVQQRDKEVARAEKKLLRQDMRDFAAVAQKALELPAEETPEVLIERLRASAQKAWSKWQSALSHARETRAPKALHELRIATKVLRYRTELLNDVGYTEMKADLKWLADLQDTIGVWHDRQVLYQAVAKAVAREEVLLNELPTARILLAELESDRKRESVDVEKIFRLAGERPGHLALVLTPSSLTQKVSRKRLGVKSEDQGAAEVRP